MLKRLLNKEGLAIAAGTMLLYTSVYFFERGYCIRLNILLATLKYQYQLLLMTSCIV